MSPETLIGALLDAAVAKALGIPYIMEKHSIPNPDPVRNMICWRATKDGVRVRGAGPYSPSTDWEIGGPLIAEHSIELRPKLEKWTAYIGPIGRPANHVLDGPTPLIAAMRALVASKKVT